jgi:hypothetical protein
VKKCIFCAISILKVIVLPSQARDKHWENTHNESWCVSLQGSSLDPVLFPFGFGLDYLRTETVRMRAATMPFRWCHHHCVNITWDLRDHYVNIAWDLQRDGIAWQGTPSLSSSNISANGSTTLTVSIKNSAPRPGGYAVQVRKIHNLVRDFVQQMIIPRQARDKHMASTQNRDVFSAGLLSTARVSHRQTLGAETQ